MFVPERTTKVDENAMAKQIVISYATQDLQRVRQLATDLRAKKFKVWFAGDDLAPPDRLSVITTRIQDCDFFIVCLSRAALNSRWVNHELNTAIALHLDGLSLQIIPLLLEPVKLPVAVADMLAINLEPDGFATLVATLRGKKGKFSDRYADFRNFVAALIPVDAKCYGQLNDYATFYRSELKSHYGPDPASIVTWRNNVEMLLHQLHMAPTRRDRVLQELDAGNELPISNEDELHDIASWLRNLGDEQLVDLAAALWCAIQTGMRGVTSEWVKDQMLESRFASPLVRRDADAAAWEGDRLVNRALNAGLLAQSTEWNHPRTYAYQDAQVNPSYDMGPMAWLIGRMANMFRQACK